MIRYTTAPEDYDGFGTKTIVGNVAHLVQRGEIVQDRVVREISIEPQNLSWQTMRYSSGSYVCLTREKFREALEMDLFRTTDVA